MSRGTVRIGTSGYVCDHWRGPFNPEDLPREAWFAHYAGEFDTVEINTTFYTLPGETSFLMEESAAPKRAAGPLVYCRFHGSRGACEGRYGPDGPADWADWLGAEIREEGRAVYACFNNDQHGCAVGDAQTLRGLLEERA
jgi:uncharacterized protein YecE (DUF72 family)